MLFARSLFSPLLLFYTPLDIRIFIFFAGYTCLNLVNQAAKGKETVQILGSF